MAQVTTYVMVSGADDPEAVVSHDLLEDDDLSLKDRHALGPEHAGALTFRARHSVEVSTAYRALSQKLSAAFPEAVVTCCEVEERFSNIERVRSILYLAGKQAGEIEHGYVFNVGAG